jgi:hypothetical protein
MVLGEGVEDLKVLADFMNVSNVGTFKQWREFLAIKNIVPSAFADIEIHPNNESFSYKSKDLQVKSDSSSMKITDNSILMIWLEFKRIRGRCRTLHNREKQIGGFRENFWPRRSFPE